MASTNMNSKTAEALASSSSPHSSTPSSPVSTSPTTTDEIAKKQRVLSIEEYEFVLCLMSSALRSFRRELVLKPFPKSFKDAEALKECVDKQIRTKNKKTIDVDYDIEHPQEKQLLHFLYEEFFEKKFELKFVRNNKEFVKKHLANAPKYVQPDFVFEVNHHLNYNHNSTYANFVQKEKQFGTLVGFHGSSFDNFYSIIRNGLQNYSGTQNQTNGAVFGDGVYFCEDLRVAKDFSKSFPTWSHSKHLGKSLSCVCLCSIINHPDDVHFVNEEKTRVAPSGSTSGNPQGSKGNRYLVVKNTENICIKYILVYSHARDADKVQKRESTSNKIIYLYIIILLVLAFLQFDVKYFLYKYLKKK